MSNPDRLQELLAGEQYEEAIDLLIEREDWGYLYDFVDRQSLGHGGLYVEFLNRLPLHSLTVGDLVRQLIEKLHGTIWWKIYESGSLTLSDRENIASLSHKAVSNASFEVFKELVRGDLLNHSRKEGPPYKLPFLLERLWREYMLQPGHTNQLKPSSKKDLLAVKCTQDIEKYPELNALWQKTEFLLQYEEGKSDVVRTPKNPFRVVHSLSVHGCPTIALWLALRLYPEQAQSRDLLGRLPLHYAAGTLPKKLFAYNYVGELSSARQYPFTLLLQAFPKGVRYADNDGKLPLRFALDQFNRPGLDKGQQHVIARWIVEPLLTHPESMLATRDPASRLYPYQLAASQDAPLDLIYKMLSGNPAVLGHRKASWIEDENEALRAKNAALKDENAQLKAELALYKSQTLSPSKRKKDEDPDESPDSKRAARVKSQGDLRFAMH